MATSDPAQARTLIELYETRAQRCLNEAEASRRNMRISAESDWRDKARECLKMVRVLTELSALQSAYAALLDAAPRMFPIMGGPPIPWVVIAACEAQAQQNHSQSVERLAQRGGLDPWEAVSVLMGQSWRESGITDRYARAKTREERAAVTQEGNRVLSAIIAERYLKPQAAQRRQDFEAGIDAAADLCPPPFWTEATRAVYQQARADAFAAYLTSEPTP